MEEGKRRKELGLPEVYLYEKDTRAVTYADFVNKELVRIYVFFLDSVFAYQLNSYVSLLIKYVEKFIKKFKKYSVSNIVLTFDCFNKLF